MSTHTPRTRLALVRCALFALSALAACGARSELLGGDAAVNDARAAATACSCRACTNSCRGPAAGCAEGELCQRGACLRGCDSASPACPSCVTTFDCDTPVQVCR